MIINKALRRIFFCTNSKIFNQKIEAYISSKDLTLINPFAQQTYKKIQIPRFPVSQSEVQALFNKNQFTQKNVIIHTNPTHFIGMKRMFFKQYLKNNVYKGFEEPNKTITQENPDKVYSLQELKFSDEIFFIFDKDVKLKGLETGSDQFYQQLQNQIQELYSSNPDTSYQRFTNRLQTQLKIPSCFNNIFIQSLNYDCQITLSGINQFTLRKILTKSLTLTEIKSLFIQSLRFYTTQIKHPKMEHMFRFQDLARQMVYLTHYTIIEPFEINHLRNLQKMIENIGEEFLSNTVIFAPSYVFDSLKSVPKQVIKQPEYNEQINKKITPQEYEKRSYQATNQRKKEADENTDLVKIEKNAILQVMLGDLWCQKMVNNKFPYLSENYIKLSIEDKRSVQEVYTHNVAKYTLAKDNYIKKWKFDSQQDQ